MTGCACDRALDTEQHARDIARRNTTQLRVVSRQPDSENRAHTNRLIRRHGRRAWLGTKRPSPRPSPPSALTRGYPRDYPQLHDL